MLQQTNHNSLATFKTWEFDFTLGTKTKSNLNLSKMTIKRANAQLEKTIKMSIVLIFATIVSVVLQCL